MERLEDRHLLSTILWVNRGGPAGDTDGFGAVFGARAALARATVDAALASWQAAITSFHYADGSDALRLTIVADAGDRTNDAVTWAGQATDGAGRPEAGTIHIGAGPDGHGAGWFLDPNAYDATAFGGALVNAYARDAQAGSPASGLGDLYSALVHEVLHTLGLCANPYLAFAQNAAGYLRNTGAPDAVDRPGTLYTFTGPSVRALFTSDDGDAADVGAAEHLAAVGNAYTDPATGLAYAGTADALNPRYSWGRRSLPSLTEALVLHDVYGYSVRMPASFLTAVSITVTGADAGGGPQVSVFQNGMLVRAFFAYDPYFTGGVRVASADVTGDGIPDIVTAPGPGMAPKVKVFDGATGALVRDFLAYDVRFQNGVFVAAADVNRDGFADIVTGADRGGGPHVEVFSGKDGSVLCSFFAYNPLFPGGVRVAAGDTDGDGFADVITAAGPGGGPHVEVWSGRDGSRIGSFMAYSRSFAGGVYVAAGDVNGDGRADVITGAGAGSLPEVKAFDVLAGGTLRDFLAYAASFAGGVRVAAADGDIVTAPGAGLAPVVGVFDGATLAGLDAFFAYDAMFQSGVYVGAAD